MYILLRIDNQLWNTFVLQDPGFFLEVEFLQAELMVKSLGNKQESYMKAAVDVCVHSILYIYILRLIVR